MLKDTLAIRAVARILLPSTSILRIAARSSMERLFILNTMPERSGIVKQQRRISDTVHEVARGSLELPFPG